MIEKSKSQYAAEPIQESGDNGDRLAPIFHLLIYTNLLLPFILTGIIVLIIIRAAKEDFSEYLNIQWREAINFNISVIVYGIVFVLLSFLIIGIPFLILLILYTLVIPIIAAVKTLDNQSYRYPFIFRII